jgi:hypothetical protein
MTDVDIDFETTEAPDPDDVEIPASLPVLPLKEMVVFPDSATPLAIGQERSIALIDDVVARDGKVALVTIKDSDVDQAGWDDLYEVGTAAIVHKLIKVPDGTLRILVQGLQRVKLDDQLSDDPYLVGEFSVVPDVVEETKELEALTRNVQMLYGRIVCLLSSSSPRPTWTIPGRCLTLSRRRCASRPRRSSACSRRPTSRSACASSRRSSAASSRSSSSARRFSPRFSRSSRRASASTSCASS